MFPVGGEGRLDGRGVGAPTTRCSPLGTRDGGFWKSALGDSGQGCPSCWEPSSPLLDPEGAQLRHRDRGTGALGHRCLGHLSARMSAQLFGEQTGDTGSWVQVLALPLDIQPWANGLTLCLFPHMRNGDHHGAQVTGPQ